MHLEHYARRGAFLLFAALVLGTNGCGGGVGVVSGKISYKNKAVVYGSVGFVGANGKTRAAKINPDGTYTVKDVAVGEAKVVVISELPRATSRSPGAAATDGPKDDPTQPEPPEVIDPEVAKKWFPIPTEFSNAAKTKLRLSVKPGANTYDIKLD
jgi:hypothetical protein